jgi:Leucine-rich repeat (LRR) protein
MTNETYNTNPIKTKSRRWFRFRLRTLLVMVTLLSVPLGWVGWELDQRRREKATIDWVEKMGGQVDFLSSFPIDERSWWEQTKDKWFGEKVLFVNLNDTQLSDLSPLSELKNLELLYLDDTQVSDLSPLAELKNIGTLDLSGTKVSNLSPLAELENLNVLFLMNTQLSDLSPLAKLKNLETLMGFGRLVSEEQVEELKKALPNCEIEFTTLNDDD